MRKTWTRTAVKHSLAGWSRGHHARVPRQSRLLHQERHRRREDDARQHLDWALCASRARDQQALGAARQAPKGTRRDNTGPCSQSLRALSAKQFADRRSGRQNSRDRARDRHCLLYQAHRAIAHPGCLVHISYACGDTPPIERTSVDGVTDGDFSIDLRDRLSRLSASLHGRRRLASSLARVSGVRAGRETTTCSPP